MELSVYDVIKKTVMTSKSVELYQKQGTMTFEVNMTANKIDVRKAVEGIWDVKVDKVRILRCPGKVKSFARKTFTSSARKKAVVTLKKGYKIEIPGMFEGMMPAEVSSAQAEEK